jgi:predicted RNA-binding protein YlqC (UPF0109 family)
VSAGKVAVIRRRIELDSAPPVNSAMTLSKQEVKQEIVVCITHILKHLLGVPAELNVTIEEGEKTTIFEVDVAKSDFGRLLGAKGKNIGSLRTLVSAIAAVHDFRAIIRIKDEDRFF